MSTTKVEKHFTIGELAREVDVTTRTIRYYEERGLLTPQRTNGQQRIYTQKDRGRLKLLLRAKGLGLKLEDIKEIFDIYDAEPNAQGEYRQYVKVREILQHRLGQIETQQAELDLLRIELQARLDDVEAQMQTLNDPQKATS
ncbi:MAG: MerR family DNA-binding transcriptional regulator [Chloroflexota bacterium]